MLKLVFAVVVTAGSIIIVDSADSAQVSKPPRVLDRSESSPSRQPCVDQQDKRPLAEAEPTNRNCAEFRKQAVTEVKSTDSADPVAQHEDDPLKNVPGLDELAKHRKVDLIPASVIPLKADEPIEVIEQSYGGPRFSILTTSNVFRVGRTITIQTTVRTSGSGAQHALYAMPALKALTSIKLQESSSEYYRAFLEKFLRAKNKMKYGGIGEWEFTVSDIAPADGVIYKMQHPIAIFKNGELECVIVSSYSPLALSFDLRQCPQDNNLVFSEKRQDPTQGRRHVRAAAHSPSR